MTEPGTPGYAAIRRGERVGRAVATTAGVNAAALQIHELVCDQKLRSVNAHGILADVSGALSVLHRIKTAAILAEQSLRGVSMSWPTEADFDVEINSRGDSSTRAPGSHPGDQTDGTVAPLHQTEPPIGSSA